MTAKKNLTARKYQAHSEERATSQRKCWSVLRSSKRQMWRSNKDDPAVDSDASFGIVSLVNWMYLLLYGATAAASVFVQGQLPRSAFGASEDNSRGQNAAHRFEDTVDEGQSNVPGGGVFLRTASGFARIIAGQFALCGHDPDCSPH